MEREFEGEGQESSRSPERPLTVVDSVRSIAAYNARAELDSEEQLSLFLQSWWSRTYNRPLKDPILLSYTLEELLYEFYDKTERQAAEEERASSENDKIEEGKEKATLDWIEQEEQRELEAMKRKQQAKSKGKAEPEPIDPTKDPDNVAWMEEQLRQAKDQYGDTFGEDLELDFER